MRLLMGCGQMSGKVMKLCRSLYGLKQASPQWHRHLVRDMRGLALEQYYADVCVMRLVEVGAVSTVVVAEVVHVDHIFTTGFESMFCDKFCEGLNQFVPINNLGELRWYAG